MGMITKDKAKNWIKNPYNIMLLALILISLVVRIYYLNFTDGQALWWDEAEYMSTAKHWVYDVPYDLNEQRPPLFQLLAAFFMILGFSEWMQKFVLVVIPSTLIPIIVYYIGKETISKRVGIIAAVLTSFCWSLLFWSARFQP